MLFYSFPQQQLSMSESELASSNLTIQIVSKSFSERLMGKFFDATQFDFVYEQSGLWSPPVRRTVFLASPAGNICSQDQILRKLNNSKKPSKRPFCFFNVCTSFSVLLYSLIIKVNFYCEYAELINSVHLQ